MKTVDIEKMVETVAREVKTYQVPVVDLIAVQTRDPFKVLVATILSARTKDETTAKAAQRLFARAADADSLATLSEEEIRQLIYPVGFYKNKARYLSQLPAALAPHNGKVPDSMTELLKLPGVGRKTANLVLAVAFGKDAICVDTHVHRIMNIWGYVETTTPEKTEMALRKTLPRRYWQQVNSILVAFGQGTCKPVGPHCDRCVVAAECPRLGVTPRRVATDKKDDIHLISWNVNGIRAMEKKGLRDIIMGLGPDIFALQETKAQPEQLSAALKEIPGYQVFFHSAQRKGYAGVAVYSRQTPVRVKEGMGQESFDSEGRVLTLEYDSFFLVNCYFPNAQHGLKRLDYKLAFNRALQEYCHELRQRKMVVICGDLNVAHQEIDLANPKENRMNPGFSDEERKWLDGMLAAGYLDTFRLFNQEGGNYTWWSYRFNARARNIGWRIDYFLVDSDHRHRVRQAEILADITGSDHCPVDLRISRTA